MDALERYQDVGNKAGILGFVPADIQVRLGPLVQRTLSLGLHVTKGGYQPPKPLPDGSRRVYLYHVRKTAGTSLVRSFLALGGEDAGAVESRISQSLLSQVTSGPYSFTCGRGTLQQGDYFFGWSHMAGHKLRLPQQTYTIALLRDPVARVLSYYRYLVAGDVADDGMSWQVQSDERELAGNGFDDFLAAVPDELLLNQVYMFSSRFDVSEAVDRVLGCSAIMMTETYERDLEDLARSLDLPLEYKRERITSLTKAPVTDEQVERLRERLASEYQLMERVAASGRLSSDA